MFKKNRKLFLLILSVGLLCSMPAVADQVADNFEDAYRLMQAGDYAEAYSRFLQLRIENFRAKDADLHQFYKAKAAYYCNWYEAAIADFKSLLTDYPDSKYVPYSYFFMGNAYYRLEHADQAVRAYLRAYGASVDNELDQLILKSIESASVDPRSAIVEQVQSIVMPEEKKCTLLASAAKALMSQKEYRAVAGLLAPCTNNEARQLTARARQFMEQEIELGVVLPFSGDLQKFGEQILEGIQLRGDMFTAETGKKIKQILYDTRGENVEAARIVRRLAVSGTTAAIGPLTSDETAVAAAALSCGEMPLMIPAASQGGLTELSSTSFQLQPNLEWQGLRMADFAIQYLKADTAAVFTPTSAENLRMTRAFTRRFEELGGTILGIEYFRQKETDFGPYVRDVKSLIVGELLDSIIFISDEGDTIEAEEVPVWIDCIYIPAEASQLRQLLPQITFYNLNTVYLGGDQWGSPTVYNLGESVTKSCYFSSGVINDGIGENYVKFVTEFDKRYGRRPGRLEGLGYDAMSLLCGAFEAGYYAHDEIVRYLNSISGFEGVSGRVTFGDNRENIELPIYMIENEEPKRVDLIPSGTPDSTLIH